MADHIKTHVGDNGRICNSCGYYEKWDQFNKDKKGFKGCYSICKECKRKNHLNRYCPTKQRAKALKKRYGITMEQYEKMLVAQHHGCKICGISSEEHGRFLFVDHCHTTGKIRGLLCHSCNTAIGLLKENLGNFRKAMQYLSAAQGGLHKPGGLEELAD